MSVLVASSHAVWSYSFPAGADGTSYLLKDRSKPAKVQLSRVDGHPRWMGPAEIGPLGSMLFDALHTLVRALQQAVTITFEATLVGICADPVDRDLFDIAIGEGLATYEANKLKASTVAA